MGFRKVTFIILICLFIGLPGRVSADGESADRNYKKAINDFEESITFFPPRFQLGLNYLHKALRYNPNDAYAKEQLRLSLMHLENPKLTIEEYEENKIKSQKAFAKGIVLFKKEKIIEARREFEKAMALDAYNPVIFEILSFIHFQSGDYFSAQITLRRLLELDPYNLQTIKNYICVLRDAKRLDEAYGFIREISIKVPEHEGIKAILMEVKENAAENIKYKEVIFEDEDSGKKA